MYQEQSDFLLNTKNLRLTLYMSLVVAHLIFGLLHPTAVFLAATGFAFFTALVLVHIRPQQAIKIEKTVHLDK